MANTTLITGTSSGIGRATASLFAGRGWNIAATMRNPDDAETLSNRPNVIILPLDVTDPQSVQAATCRTIERFGQLDALVNNAGFAVMGPLEATPPESVERQFATNLLGPINLIRAVLPHFRERSEGVIVNVSSTVGRTAFPLGSLYAASKFALEGLSEGLRFELDAIGVRMKVVEPGLIATDFATRSLEFHADGPDAYAPLLAAMGQASEGLTANSEPPAVVAEAIWTAVTDGTNTLRYPAGETARQALIDWAGDDDKIHYGRIREQFRL